MILLLIRTSIILHLQQSLSVKHLLPTSASVLELLRAANPVAKKPLEKGHAWIVNLLSQSFDGEVGHFTADNGEQEGEDFSTQGIAMIGTVQYSTLPYYVHPSSYARSLREAVQRLL